MAVAAVQTRIAARSAGGSEVVAREFYFFNLFRVLEAFIIVALMFSAYAVEWVSLVHPLLGRETAVFYLIFAIFAAVFATRETRYFRAWIDLSLVVDILACALAMFAIHHQFISLALLLLVNIGGAATLLPRRMSFFFAALATFGVFAQNVFGNLINQDNREILEAGICGLAYFCVTGLCVFLGRRMRDSEALASRRGSDLRNLAQINELIIRRMKTGVLVVDGANIVHRWNESAAALIGNPTDGRNDLARIAPELSRRLYHWRTSRKIDNTAISLAEGAPEVIPRFTRMAANDDENVLVFLDDTSLVSRRAEQLTLASMGRLAGSIAHEIRNPLAAISYSAQLLSESESLDQADRRMIEIIRNHAGRVNEIVENILHLARRERSMPEIVDLVAWAERFIADFKATIDVGANTVACKPQQAKVETLVDPKQLHQVVWNLVQNALRYGHAPGEPARVSLTVRQSTDRGLPMLDVVDRGPGIPAKVAAQIFEPFFTTHELGTGLGLYLAREMCVANLATLEYLPLAGGGSCFRVTFPPPPMPA
ncbi:MAG: ATP-binding protein [Rudaea sp.]|uniref:sensor histidine kinase n=1 Tax=Rudaea sp. TaxID=2136325 RepID=UPI0039E4D176